jgi:hypothetical protein
VRFELSTKPSTRVGLLQSVWSFHRTPAMCMKFWLDLANVYKVLLRTTALPHQATHHTSANEHDELRRSVDFPRRSKQLGPQIGLARLSWLLSPTQIRPDGGTDKNLVSQSRSSGQYDVGVNTSTNLGLHQSAWSFHPRPAMCIKFCCPPLPCPISHIFSQQTKTMLD